MHLNLSTIRRTSLVTAMLAGGALAPNAFAADATAATSGTVVTPITITQATDLNFGEFAADPDTAGTMTVSTGGAASALTAVVTNDASVTAASFDVAGSASASYSISISDNELTHTDLATTMALTTTHDLDALAGDDPAAGTLDGTGVQTIYVGGELAVAAAQLAGVYSGTITATVEYN